MVLAIFGFALVWFGSSLVQMTYLRPPLNVPAWIHAFWHPTCCCRPKIGQNHGFGYIFSFGFVLLGFWLVQITNLWLPLNFPAWVHNFWYPTCHCWWKKAKTMVLAISLVLVWYGLVLDMFKSLIWGHHWIPLHKYMPFDTQHITVAQKLTKTLVLAIFLVLAPLGLVLVLVFVQILNLLAEPVPTIPHTPKLDLKCLRNSGELTWFHIQNLKCAQIAAEYACRHNSQHLLRRLLENLTQYKFYGHENPSENDIKRQN